jgi:hypothetical protein
MSFYAPRYDRGFDAGKAYRTRIDDAVGDAGPDLILAAALRVVEEIGEIDIYSAEAVQRMRDLGGFSALIERAIGDRPDPEANEIGFATNSGWYIWTWLHDQTVEIRLTAQAMLRDRQAAS